MPEITFKCSKCNADIEADETFAGSVAQCPNCNETVMIPMPGIKPGMKISGYEIIRRLGAGGMGEVWLANQTAMDRRVALKILSPALTSSLEFIERFLKEVKNTAKLEHANIVTAHDAGFDNKIYYLAMSYVDGVVLEDRLSIDKYIPEKDALKIVRCVAEALRYAWDEFKILHRDIKPANIMLDKFGNPKLMDMGISKSMTEEKGLTMTGMIVGTPYYMSPEQSRADAGIDCRADIYSLGATLYHLVTGSVPYDGTTAMGILMKHVTDPFPSPQERNPEVSIECSVLLEIMMAKSPDDRQNTWKDVIRDIDLVLSGELPSSARPIAGKSVVMRAPGKDVLSKRRPSHDPQKARLATVVSDSVINSSGKITWKNKWYFLSALSVIILLLSILLMNKGASKADNKITVTNNSPSLVNKPNVANPVKKDIQTIDLGKTIPPISIVNKEDAETARKLAEDEKKNKMIESVISQAENSLKDKKDLANAKFSLDNILPQLKGMPLEAKALSLVHSIESEIKNLEIENKKNQEKGKAEDLKKIQDELNSKIDSNLRKQTAVAQGEYQKKLAHLVLNGDFSTALSEYNSSTLKASSPEIEVQLKKLVESDSLVMQSFKSDIGKEINLELSGKTETVKVKDITGDTVLVEAKSGVAIFKRKVHAADLSIAERIKRIALSDKTTAAILTTGNYFAQGKKELAVTSAADTGSLSQIIMDFISESNN